jgi:hypothetical protein
MKVEFGMNDFNVWSNSLENVAENAQNCLFSGRKSIMDLN